MEECNSLDESIENLDRNSLTSFGSGNTTDSDKVSFFLFLEMKQNCTVAVKSDTEKFPLYNFC